METPSNNVHQDTDGISCGELFLWALFLCANGLQEQTLWCCLDRTHNLFQRHFPQVDHKLAQKQNTKEAPRVIQYWTGAKIRLLRDRILRVSFIQFYLHHFYITHTYFALDASTWWSTSFCSGRQMWCLYGFSFHSCNSKFQLLLFWGLVASRMSATT